MDVAAGVKVFLRSECLRSLLDSIPPDVISTVYVADDGPDAHKVERKEQVYGKNWSFDLELIDLESDSGVAYGRHMIVEEFSEDYLLMLDSDFTIPTNVDLLVEILEGRPDLGGVTGALVEPENNRYHIQGADFSVEDEHLILDPYVEEKEIEFVGGAPLIRFDFIPNVALFRRECLQDYAWDPHYDIGFEHADFYLGHWRGTDWSFAVCPQVIFPHYPGGDDEYLSHRWSERKLHEKEPYFLDKWGYESWQAEGYYWCHSDPPPPPLVERAKQVFRDEGTMPLVKRSARFAWNNLRP